MSTDSLLQNIKKAQEEIDRLEEEAQRATDGAKKVTQQNGHAEAKQEKDAVANASEELQKASLEDKQ